MKKLSKNFTLAILATIILSGCSSNKSTMQEEDCCSEYSLELSGTITINGSTSMEKLSNSLAEVFMEKYPNVSITPQFTGSGAGIESVSNGTVDIGNSSRALKEEEKAKGVVENIVAIDGIAVIVDNSNEVSNLTKEQLKGIYNRTITKWSEVGGPDKNIVVIGRESGSGTRRAFEEMLDLEDSAIYAQEIDSTGAVVGKVSSIEGSIGYVSLDVLDNEKIKVLMLEGKEPTIKNIKSGEYFLSRPFIMATKGELYEQSLQVQELFNFIYSEDGKEVIEKVGLISVD